ncbi:MAG TPA: FAD-dependent oxidoreductase, partial [Vicinamibacteria bacterium]|nr:FAD-dependent oxidoreductase [Vicinamibacteria bacterium]
APGMVGLLEPRAGVLFPEACIEAALAGAVRAGATVRLGEEAQNWTADDDGVTVRTSGGAWSAGQVVFAAGAWISQLVPDLPLAVERQVLHWFEPTGKAEALSPDACPIALWEFAPGRVFYTFPDMGDGVKAALHHDGEPADPDRVRREVSVEDEEEVRALLARLVPAAAGRLRESCVCLYTNSPDQHFLIDRHPAHARVLLVSPCSGHGFKFAPVVGEAVADLLLEGRSRFDLRPFALDRFGASAP